MINPRINPNKIWRRKQQKENEGTYQLALLNLGKEKNVVVKKRKEECSKFWRRKKQEQDKKELEGFVH